MNVKLSLYLVTTILIINVFPATTGKITTNIRLPSAQPDYQVFRDISYKK